MNMAITWGACVCVCLGIFLIFQSNILYLFKAISYQGKSAYKEENPVKKHLRHIFEVVTNGKHIEEKIVMFFLLSVLILTVMSATMLQVFGIKGILTAMLMAAMPYGYIRARMYVKQVTGSFEGEMLVDELLNQYKICEGNIYEAIDRCVIVLGEETLSKKALFRFAMKLHSYAGEKELTEALNDFAGTWNTVWARMLADNIYNAVKEEVDVRCGLENILAGCKEINRFIEENKKEGMETEVVVKVICPLFFIVLLFMAKNMMGYSWGTLFRYEFAEQTGLTIFSALIFLTGLNLIVFPVLGKQKYDF